MGSSEFRVSRRWKCSLLSPPHDTPNRVDFCARFADRANLMGPLSVVRQRIESVCLSPAPDRIWRQETDGLMVFNLDCIDRPSGIAIERMQKCLVREDDRQNENAYCTTDKRHPESLPGLLNRLFRKGHGKIRQNSLCHDVTPRNIWIGSLYTAAPSNFPKV